MENLLKLLIEGHERSGIPQVQIQNVIIMTKLTFRGSPHFI